MTSSLCVLGGLYLVLIATHPSQGVALALRPVFLAMACVALIRCIWILSRRPSAHSVAAELDERADLKDELKSACWFASRASMTEWESALLVRAIRTLQGIDAVSMISLRPTGGPVRAVGIGLLVLAVGLLAFRSGGGHPMSADAKAEWGDGSRTALSNSAPEWAQREEQGRADPHAEGTRTLRALPADAGAVVERRARDVRSGPDPADDTTPGGPRRENGPRGGHAGVQEASDAGEAADSGPGGALERALELSAELARGAVERVQSFLGKGSAQTPRAELGADLAEARSGAGQGVERQDALQEHTTMSEMSQAMQQLAPSLDGDRPAPSRSASEPPSPGGGGKANISGGTDGMRVNINQTGDDGDDAPPDAPLSEPETLHGRKTERLVVKLDRLVAGSGGGQAASEESEGFYEASRAQAARIELSATAAVARGRSDAAVSNEKVPVAYRGTVKRYFVLEHGREK